MMSAIKFPSVELKLLELKSPLVYNWSENPIILSKLTSIESL